MRYKHLILHIGLFFLSLVVRGQGAATDIRLNQLGFYPNAPKVAFVTNGSPGRTFWVLSLSTGDTVFTGTLGAERRSPYSSVITRAADFTHLTISGTFKLAVAGVGTSYPFRISENSNRPVAVAALKGFYFQRVSMPLKAEYAGKWHRPAGHPDTSVLIHPSAASHSRPAGTRISSPGGWYDAGDYNKYVVNSGITMGTLLSAYEDFPQYFDSLRTNIPESGNRVPDILDEVIYNLRWMLTMQDPGDGGVYHKCTNAAFDGMVMPGVTKAPRFVVQKSTAAALDFAAVTAQASRIFRRFERELPGLADSCLHASEKAWAWSLKHPSVVYDQEAINLKFEPKISTGSYGDKNLSDEWRWAAAELFTSTHRRAYFEVLTANATDSAVLPSWSNVAMLGSYTMVRNSGELPEYSQSTVRKLRSGIVTYANQLIANAQNSAFNTVIGQSKADFIWGSNAVAANQGIALVNAYLQTGDRMYVNYALTNLDYILGRNATGYSFVTGIGSHPTMHPHHRPSVSDGIDDPVPGLLAGGPNPGRQDKCHYEFLETETSYSDSDCSYASNEIAINWNAPLVYLSNAIEALQKKVGY